MKKIYHEYFHIPENGKISDKVMLGRTVVAALCVILCLCAFSVSTYAYYYMTVSSSGNNVQAATFEAEVHVFDGNEDVAATDGVYRLNAGTTYKVAMQLSGSVNNAHVAIYVSQPAASVAAMALDEGQEPDGLTVGTYYTETIEMNGETKTVQFDLKVASDAEVTLQPRWGKAPTGDGGNIAVSDTSLLEEEEELETATPSDLQGDSSVDPVEPDKSANTDDSADPDTSDAEENGSAGDTEPVGEGEPAGEGDTAGEGDAAGDDATGGDGAAVGEDGAADGATPAGGDTAGDDSTTGSNVTVDGDGTAGGETT